MTLHRLALAGLCSVLGAVAVLAALMALPTDRHDGPRHVERPPELIGR